MARIRQKLEQSQQFLQRVDFYPFRNGSIGTYGPDPISWARCLPVVTAESGEPIFLEKPAHFLAFVAKVGVVTAYQSEKKERMVWHFLRVVDERTNVASSCEIDGETALQTSQNEETDTIPFTITHHPQNLAVSNFILKNFSASIPKLNTYFLYHPLIQSNPSKT